MKTLSSVVCSVLFSAVISACAFSVSCGIAFAEDIYYGKDDCISCHSMNGYLPDTHHMLIYKTDGLECLSCHTLVRNPVTGQFYFRENDCRGCHGTDQIHSLHHNAHHLSTKTPGDPLCSNCHASTPVQTTLQNGMESFVISYSNTRQCGACHQPPADEYIRLKNADAFTLPDSAIAERYLFGNMNDKDFATAYMLNRTENKAIAMKLHEEADALSGVYLRLYVTGLDGGPQNVRIYPYQADGDSIDAGTHAAFTLSSSGWNTLDVTPLLEKMRGFGWIKFRVVNTMDTARVSEADFFVRYKNKIDADSAMFLKFKGALAFSASNQGAHAEPASDFTIAEQLRDNDLAAVPVYGYTVFKNRTESSAVVMRFAADSGLMQAASIRLYAYLPYIKTKGAPGSYQPQTLIIYPYKADGRNIDTSGAISVTVTIPGWQEIDVTPLLPKMTGFGWMKFRIVNSTNQLTVTEGFLNASRR